VEYDQKWILFFVYSTRYSWQSLMNLEFPRHIFEKYSNIKIHENPPSKSRVVSCEMMEKRSQRRTHMTVLLLAFCDFAKVPKKGTSKSS